MTQEVGRVCIRGTFNGALMCALLQTRWVTFVLTWRFDIDGGSREAICEGTFPLCHFISLFPGL